jgi:hypothetical protein
MALCESTSSTTTFTRSSCFECFSAATWFAACEEVPELRAQAVFSILQVIVFVPTSTYLYGGSLRNKFRVWGNLSYREPSKGGWATLPRSNTL